MGNPMGRLVLWCSHTRMLIILQILQFFVSCRSFRKGGNYCPEEVEIFNRKIVRIVELIYSIVVSMSMTINYFLQDKISTKIASTKSFLNKEITQLMVTHQQKASRALNSLRDW